MKDLKCYGYCVKQKETSTVIDFMVKLELLLPQLMQTLDQKVVLLHFRVKCQQKSFFCRELSSIESISRRSESG